MSKENPRLNAAVGYRRASAMPSVDVLARLVDRVRAGRPRHLIPRRDTHVSHQPEWPRAAR